MNIDRMDFTGKAQRGFGFFSVLAILVLVVVLGGTAMKSAPALLEYAAIQRAVNQIATEGTESAAEIQRAFDRYAAIEDIETIAGRDLIIAKTQNEAKISFRYERRVHMVGPINLLFDFEGDSGQR
ncbi:MAG: DUF4845 domain-containing protein [Burkholderiaceae bacterium]|nr:DUF4845 domain-containing protein [Burkholderiaceae bacterium]